MSREAGQTPPEAEAASDDTRTVLPSGVATGELLAGRYRLGEVLGRGGMGLVYRATDERLDLDVAVKLLRPEHGEDAEVAARFTREILLARQVSHRNVVRIHDLGEDADRGLAFLTMDLVEGRSLKALLAEEERFAPLRAAELVAQVAEGLAAAHHEGVVHRDLKPSNVLVDPEGRAYVTDFGIARSLSGGALTRTGGIVGTPAYLSPEQARGERVDARSDVYSLGLILYRMLAGRPAFPVGTFTEMVSQRIGGRPRDLAEVAAEGGVEVPAWLLAVVRRCLQYEPEERYADAAALAADLRVGLAGEAPEAAAGSPGGSVGGTLLPGDLLTGPRSRRLLVTAVAILATLAVALWLVLWWAGPRGGVSGPDPDPTTSAPTAAHSLVVLPLDMEGMAGAASEAGEEAGEEDGEEAGEEAGPLVVAQVLERRLAGTFETAAGSGAGDGSPEVPRLVDSLRAARTVADLGLPRGDLRPPDLRQLGDLLAADRIVAGRVAATDAGVRVDGRLWRLGEGGVEGEAVSAEGADLWAAVDAFAAELGRRLVGAPAATASPGGGRGAAGGAEGLSRDPAALAAYETGLDALLAGDAVTAEPALERAVAADPGFAAAWVRLADARATLGRFDAAVEAAERAIDGLPAGDSRPGLRARAQLASLRGEPEAAADLLSRLVEAHPNDLEARVDYGEAALDAGLYDRADAALAEVTRVDPNHPRAWFLLGKLAILTGDYRRASDDYLVRALTIQNRLGNPQGRADTENALGIALLNLGDLEASRRHFTAAADLRRDLGDRRGLAATLSNLGLVASQSAGYAAAREAFEESLAIRREIGDRAGVAALYNSLGFLEEEQGTYRQALTWYRRGLEERRAGGDPRAVAESLNNVGFAYFLLGDLDNAAVYWDRALEMHRDTGNDDGVLATRQNLGLLDLARGEWNGALAAFLETLESSRSLGLLDAEAVSLGNLGRVAQLQGRPAAALAAFDQALERVGELEDPRGLVEFHLMKADAALELGGVEVAAAELDAAGRWLEEGGNREQRGELERLRGRLALARGDAAAARRHLDRAADAAEASGSRHLELATRLARAEWELARPNGAAAALDAATVVHDEAAASGLRPLALTAGELVAAAHAAAGRPTAAEEAARAALADARRLDPWGRAFRLHRLRAGALEAVGGPAGEREAAWDEAARHLARVRRGLRGEASGDTGGDADDDELASLRAAFAVQPAVAAVDRHRPAGARPGDGGDDGEATL